MRIDIEEVKEALDYLKENRKYHIDCSCDTDDVDLVIKVIKQLQKELNESDLEYSILNNHYKDLKDDLCVRENKIKEQQARIEELEKDSFESESNLIKIAASLVRCNALLEFNNVCESQKSISTNKLRYVVERSSNHLKDYAVAIREALQKPPEGA